MIVFLNKRINKILFSAIVFLSLIFILSVSFSSRADTPNWTDEGKYDAAWLGDYEKTEVYEIRNKQQLAAFLVASKSGKTFEKKTIKMYADLDMSECYWSACFSADSPFLGTFEGRGYFIKGLVFNSTDTDTAFISYNGGTIVNALFSVTSQASNSAGIAVTNNGKIYNSGVTGIVGNDTTAMSGGISVYNNGTIENCYSILQIKGTSHGGICAKNSGTVNTCAWSGSETGSTELTNFNNSEKLDDKQAICNKLNKQTKERGWMNWLLDTTSTFGGNPILTSKEVTATTQNVKGISFNVRQKTLSVGGDFTLKYTLVPANPTNPKVKLFSTNEAVAVVDSTGKVKAVGKGYAVIRAITEDGNKVADCYVTVQDGVYPNSIKLENTHFRILVGKPVQLKYTITPWNAAYWGATFSVGDSSIVECSDNGLITGLAPGATVVTATTNDGSKAVSALVTVVEDTFSEVWDGNVAESFGGGSGTEEDPYIIENGAQLAFLSDSVNDGNDYNGIYFRQTVSILFNDISAVSWYDELSDVRTWTPIGKSADTPFRGHYDGGSFAVGGIYIRTDSLAGLFGYVEGGEISNLEVKNSFIQGGDYSGAICAFSSSSISLCEAGSSTIIKGNKYVGGIVGYTSSRIDFSKSVASVEGAEYVGGICGATDNVLTNCQNNGSIKGNDKVGGICGSAAMPIENCVNHGIVQGIRLLGGICGYSNMTVVNSYSSIYPQGTDLIGYVCGYAEKPISSFSLDDNKACGNRDNDKLYTVSLEGDGTLVIDNDNSPLYIVLNLHKGCLFSDSYYIWDNDNKNSVKHTYSTNAYSRITDEDTGFEISVEGYNSDFGFVIEALSDTDKQALAEILNSSIVFEKSKLEAENILDCVNINTNSDFPLYSFNITLPLDFSKTSLEVSVPDHQSFAHVAIANVLDGEVYIYIPEIVSKTVDGKYIGMLKCISHKYPDGSVEEQNAISAASSFIYDAQKISMSTSVLGNWMIVDLENNEYVVPIETGNAEVQLPDKDTEKNFDYKPILTIVGIVSMLSASAVVVLIRRKKNLNV